MPWATNPLFRSREAPATAPEDVEDPERQVVLQGVRTTFRKPTDKMTLHQFFYIFIVDGICAAAISAGINLAIAYAMYIKYRKYELINLFQFPTTLAGDAGVTIIIQCIITWLIELFLVNNDLKGGHVAPVGFLTQPTSPPLRWFLFLDRTHETHCVGGALHWARFLVSQVLRAFLVSVLCFCLLWAPFVGAMTAFGVRDGGDWTYGPDRRWTPPIFKAVLGGVLGLLTTPAFTLFWLVRCGWALQRNERHYGQTRKSGEWRRRSVG